MTGRFSTALAGRTRDVLIGAFIVAIAAADGLLSVDDPTGLDVALTLVGSAALVARRRIPVTVFALTLPGLALGTTYMATIIALATVAYYVEHRWIVFVCGASSFTANMVWIATFSSFSPIVQTLLSTAATTLAPMAIGQLISVRGDLTRQLAELEQARERDLRAQAELALSTERARLAREMHDVVSHQVSLIAVQVGALLVSNEDPAVKAASRIIRSLAVRTLDELRQMVSVLRASGGDAEGIDPQPAIEDLRALTAESGLDVDLVIAVESDIADNLQRAAYRIVQEGLTNVRKHAPGSSVAVSVIEVDRSLTVVVANTAATQVLQSFPSARHGLVGLAERAELLGGHVSAAGTSDNGFTLRVDLPLQ
ncbi:two-component sensor histidine kinase [Rhodococcoides fascians A21d2]|uniref:sensor histidine kinase n=1 Tax=Rhodococcoides fascians TaxID=1828 RepID=UPI00068B4BAE|nr:histidine kinase [Rhodococcus fascians]QII00264.1 two-component sensor histidine kinase [Rhodococcus fascians A21d2]